jgi:hypothetical protein
MDCIILGKDKYSITAKVYPRSNIALANHLSMNMLNLLYIYYCYYFLIYSYLHYFIIEILMCIVEGNNILNFFCVLNTIMTAFTYQCFR